MTLLFFHKLRLSHNGLLVSTSQSVSPPASGPMDAAYMDSLPTPGSPGDGRQLRHKELGRTPKVDSPSRGIFCDFDHVLVRDARR